MGEKIVVAPINSGLKTNRIPPFIDNDSFPTLINAFQWRGRIRRKRGTTPLNRLMRYFDCTSTAYTSTSSLTLAAGAQNLITGFSLESTASIIPGLVEITDTNDGQVYTDLAKDGTLAGDMAGTGTINYASGAITITGGAAHVITCNFSYYPGLPVLGLEDLELSTLNFPGTLAFDDTYSYNIQTDYPYQIYDVSFYKNPSSTGTYVQKTTWTPTSWNGENYQQFWTTNYEGALWATNGINVPFAITYIGMQYDIPTAINRTSATTVDFTIVGNPLVVGDFVFINEVVGVADPTAATLNFQTGYVTAAGNTFTVTFPNAAVAADAYSMGMVQYLTNRSDTTKDCLRWYDGDPTDGNPTSPSFDAGKGWVNYCPPLSFLDYSIATRPADQYYLVGARMIIPFKDRLLFLGPVIQTSSAGSQIYLQDTIIYSQNGTPYYTASFTGDPDSPTTVFNPLLVPTNRTATPTAMWEDITGFGGFISAGLDMAMTSVSTNDDVLIIGFERMQTRLIFTNNDVIPFNFYIINSEYGTGNPFASINTDSGVLSKGSRGFIITSQTSCNRFDVVIPDLVFEQNLVNNGTERITSARDFVSEWIYFTFNSNQFTSTFPNQTLIFNYRDNSFGVFNESYTTYGLFRRHTGQTWNTLPPDLTWETWNVPWDSGEDTLFNPEVIGGNQQGFVVFREQTGTSETDTLFIQDIATNLVTSPDHGLNTGDYIIISDALGTIASEVNGKIFSVLVNSGDDFYLNPPIGSGTYLGAGVIKRMYVPYIQTKQFPVSWQYGRKTRLGPQQYLLTTTENSQVTLLIFLSQNGSTPYNLPPIVPSIGSVNDSLIYSTILYTGPESTNLGLTPANTNLNMLTASQQQQIWHRMNTSLLGDTVQIGITLNDDQMRYLDDSGNPDYQFAEIELHAMILDVNPSALLA